MVTTSPRARAVAAALLFCLSCLGLAVFLWLELGGTIPFAAQGYRVHILFSQASQLYPNAAVRIAGVDVGHVVSVERAGELSDTTIELDSPYVPLHRDAEAMLRQKTLLGEMFVALAPGNPHASAIPDEGTLGRGQVQPIQTLDEVLNSFDAPTRSHFRELLVGLSDVVAGPGGSELNSALGNAGPAADQLDALVSTLDTQGGALRTLIRDTGTVLAAVSARQSDLQQLIRAGDQVFATTAAHDRGVTATVRALPPFLAQLRHTLTAADRTAAIASPTLSALLPVAPLVRPALSKLLNVSGPLTTLVHRLTPFLGLVRRSLPSATQLLSSTHRLIRRLYPVAQSLVPVIAYLSAYRRELVAAMANMGAATQATSPSATGRPAHYLRTVIAMNNESVVGAPKRLPSNRHNAYFAPGSLSRIGHGGLQASDCMNTHNPNPVPIIGGGSPPPCQVAPPWLFQAQQALFHRLAPQHP